MPVHTSSLGRYAVVVAEGRYDPADLRAGIDTALARFPDGRPAALLIDFSSSLEVAEREMTQVRAMAFFLASRGDAFDWRLAMVAPSNAAFGVIRLGSVTTERRGLDTRVFRSLASALEWLDTGRDPCEPEDSQE